MNLPDLRSYRQEFAGQNATVSLPFVPCAAGGLLKELPPPPQGKTGFPWTEEVEPVEPTLIQALPKISVVTPSFNQAHYIEETIRSVLLQNYPKLEYVILDGGSTDGSVEIIKKYEPWLSLWTSGKDRGQAHAINKGLAVITGEYWQWINSDDRYLPGVLQRIGETLRRGEYDTLYGGVHESTDDNSIAYDCTSFNVSSQAILDPKATFNKDFYYKPEATVLSVNRSRGVGGFREDFQNMFDTEFMTRYAISCRPIYTDLKLIHFRIHDESKTVATARRIYEEYYTMLDEQVPRWSADRLRFKLKKAGFLSTCTQSSGAPSSLLGEAVRLPFAYPYVLASRAYWGLWRKIINAAV